MHGTETRPGPIARRWRRPPARGTMAPVEHPSRRACTMSDEHRFLQRFLPVQPRLRAYLWALLRDAQAVDDVFQEVAIALWEHRTEYDPQRGPFLPWTLGVARRHVARWRRGRVRSRLVLVGEVEERIAAAFEELEDELDGRRRALRRCLAGLGPAAQDLLRQRYEQERSLQEMAEASGRTLNAVNKALGKVRAALQRCTRQLLTEEPA